MPEGVRFHRVAIRETLARIRSLSPAIRVLRVSIRCMPEGIRVHPVAIRETSAQIRSHSPPIRKRQGHVQHNRGEYQQRSEEFCVQDASDVRSVSASNTTEEVEMAGAVRVGASFLRSLSNKDVARQRNR